MTDEPTSAFIRGQVPDKKKSQSDSGDAPIGETAPHTPVRPASASRGLRIQCPHCSNRVELLADTPYAEITCRSCGSSFNLVDRDDQTRQATPLKSIGRFDLISRLGVGGFGTVWKARDTQLDRIVAVKIPRRGQLEEVEIEQFFREARAAAQLQHPYIVPVHEVGLEEETIFIVSDLIRGVELSDYLTGHQPTYRESAELCAKIADALHHAHQHGIIHRDLKPSNIMMDEQDQPHLMDFGLAKRDTGELTLTLDGHVLGTPAYMSPEQARGHGRDTDRRTDVYSLGVVLFRMLTGELPFRGNAQMQVHQRLTEDPPDPRKLSRHIPRDLATICLKCLERDVSRRYASTDKVQRELKRFLNGVPILARPLSRPARLFRWAQRNPALATVAMLVSFLAVAGPLAAVRIDQQRRRLQSLVVEKNHLIDQSAVEKQHDVATISGLTAEIDRWTGKANPWQLWPPEPMASPRRALLEKLFEQQYQTLCTQWKEGSYRPRQRAAGQMGLARMTDQLGYPDHARKHYRAARDLLSSLSQQHPQETRYREALADCHAQLARLHGSQEKAKAEDALRQASGLYRQLAQEHEGEPRYPIEGIETELQRGVLAGFEGAAAHLNQAAQWQQSLGRQWPSEPVALYELVSSLTQQEPLLSPRVTSENPNQDQGEND